MVQLLLSIARSFLFSIVPWVPLYYQFLFLSLNWLFFILSFTFLPFYCWLSFCCCDLVHSSKIRLNCSSLTWLCSSFLTSSVWITKLSKSKSQSWKLFSKLFCTKLFSLFSSKLGFSLFKSSSAKFFAFLSSNWLFVSSNLKSSKIRLSSRLLFFRNECRRHSRAIGLPLVVKSASFKSLSLKLKTVKKSVFPFLLSTARVKKI
ncbi:hypothetical protein MHL_2854 [Mesomycoplasma hyopneumoniae 7422]|nr:hypothetical protein MHL_2854 [Mesomycoplasma hyopneumoniae 7422]